MKRSGRKPAAIVLTSLALALAGVIAGSTTAFAADKVVNVLMVNNPQMMDLAKLTEDHFTKKTGIKVNYTILPENQVRAKIATEFSSQAGQYDVATISNYQVGFYAKNDWLLSLNDSVAKDPTFDQADILKPIAAALTVDGQIYAEPFYGESSFLMYRKDIFKQLGMQMPLHPTWGQVAKFAAKIHKAKVGVDGICLRGQPGWGEIFAPLTTVVNTFGGTWWDKDWNAKVNAKPFVKATKFYVDLVREYGEAGAAQAGYTECLNDMMQGKVAMWYDATAAAGSLEGDNSKVKGKVGYVFAPVKKTKNSGWLYSWAFAIEKSAPHKEAAEKFIEWATGKDYIKLAGETYGWTRVPPGTRDSTYANPHYQKAAAAFYKQVHEAINSATPNNPGVQPRPAPGIQFVAIPEFASVATQVSQGISAAIAGQGSVKQALDRGQRLAERVGKHHKRMAKKDK